LLDSLKRLLDEAIEYLTADSHDDDTLPADEALEDDPITELQGILEELMTIIQCLYKLARIIRNPTKHDFLKESHRSEDTAIEPFYQQHVRNKFPLANEELTLRLAKAMARRRSYFKYRERHNIKLGKGLEDMDTRAVVQLPAGTISETLASSIQPQPIEYDDAPSSDSGVSRTSYAPSILEGGTITVPAAPKESISGQPFVCPYCYFIVNIKTTRSWYRHVFIDLRPYSCPFQKCRTPDKLYSSRRDWFAHVSGAHDIVGLSCPLCADVLTTKKMFERHIARHLEELALFVLPRVEDVSEEKEELHREDENHGEDDASSGTTSEVDESPKSEIFEKSNFNLTEFVKSIYSGDNVIRAKNRVELIGWVMKNFPDFNTKKAATELVNNFLERGVIRFSPTGSTYYECLFPPIQAFLMMGSRYRHPDSPVLTTDPAGTADEAPRPSMASRATPDSVILPDAKAVFWWRNSSSIKEELEKQFSVIRGEVPRPSRVEETDIPQQSTPTEIAEPIEVDHAYTFLEKVMVNISVLLHF
ncbi:MAG: hypothetical protein Q9224_006694, partial [Gallowayella concinna]